MMSSVDGYKTYMVMAAVLFCVFLKVGLGIDVPGFDVDQSNWLNWVIGALGFGAVRSALTKV